jgi:hypothetical protein
MILYNTIACRRPDSQVIWDEAGELSGVRPRVDGQRRRLREPRTGNPDLRVEGRSSDEYIFFGAE